MAKTKQPTTENGLVLGEDLFWRWRALSSDHERLILTLQAKTKDLELALSLAPEIRSLMEQRTSLIGEMATAKSELLTIQKEIEATHKILLKDCAIDDRTRRVYNLAADGTKTPIVGNGGNKAPKNVRKKGR
jgi:hypothetical protein